MIETCRSVLSVLMYTLEFLNYIYIIYIYYIYIYNIYLCMCVYVLVCVRMGEEKGCKGSWWGNRRERATGET